MARGVVKSLAALLALVFLFSGCADLFDPLPKPLRSRAGRGAYDALADSLSAINEDDIAEFNPGPRFLDELREKVYNQQVSLEGNPKRVPVVPNEEVRSALVMFLTSGRGFFLSSLKRSSKYLPMIKQILAEKGLPTDLAYLPLVESGYNEQAVSPAGAVGLWQFIPSTGRHYGLRVDGQADERLDPIKSTYAAAEYLSDLYGLLGCWHLAAAAYNAGEGKILFGVKKFNTRDFWEISRQTFLAGETKKYVPYFLAALVIAKDPERFGLPNFTAGPGSTRSTMGSREASEEVAWNYGFLSGQAPVGAAFIRNTEHGNQGKSLFTKK